MNMHDTGRGYWVLHACPKNVRMGKREMHAELEQAYAYNWEWEIRWRNRSVSASKAADLADHVILDGGAVNPLEQHVEGFDLVDANYTTQRTYIYYIT
jgi:hypothetical protein